MNFNNLSTKEVLDIGIQYLFEELPKQQETEFEQFLLKNVEYDEAIAGLSELCAKENIQSSINLRAFLEKTEQAGTKKLDALILDNDKDQQKSFTLVYILAGILVLMLLALYSHFSNLDPTPPPLPEISSDSTNVPKINLDSNSKNQEPIISDSSSTSENSEKKPDLTPAITKIYQQLNEQILIPDWICAMPRAKDYDLTDSMRCSLITEEKFQALALIYADKSPQDEVDSLLFLYSLSKSNKKKDFLSLNKKFQANQLDEGYQSDCQGYSNLYYISFLLQEYLVSKNMNNLKKCHALVSQTLDNELFLLRNESLTDILNSINKTLNSIN